MFTMIHLKSPKEIETMRGASKIVAEILLELRENIRDGATTADIDKIAEDLTLKKRAKPAFKGYRGFPASLCISVNDQVVHGIPSPKRMLKKGDIVVLDFGVIDDGWTVVTADGKPSAHFEHTVAVTPNGPEILTKI